MTVNAIIILIQTYFIMLGLSAALYSFKKTSKLGNVAFVAGNAAGMIAGAGYLASLSGSLVLGQAKWFFGFAPTFTFLSALIFSLVCFISALVGVYGGRYLEAYAETYDQKIVQLLIVVFVAGMQGVLLSDKAMVFMVFWEIMSVASFFLVLSDKTHESFKAGFLYFIMTHLGAAAIMSGFLILGRGSLSLELSGIKATSAGLTPALSSLAAMLFLFGFGSKAGLVPFHVWLPEAHPQAPSNVSALMSGLMLKIAVYGFCVTFASFSGLPTWTALIVIVLGLVSGLYGALYASLEKDIKRTFAFSSIENIGLIFTILGLALYFMEIRGGSLRQVGISFLAFALFHAVNHAMFKTALFLSSGVIISKIHSRSLEVMGGFAKASPALSAVFLLSILASLPIPPFGTFYGEWGTIKNIISQLGNTGADFGSVAVLAGSLSLIGLISGLAIFAMVKVFGISMLGLPRSKNTHLHPEKGDMVYLAPIAILAICVLVLGIFAKSLLSWLIVNLGQANFAGVIADSDFRPESLWLAVLIVAIFLSIFSLRRLLSDKQNERGYQTWDCGQPINETMEYTASAFSAPIRFFFFSLLKRRKQVSSVPVVATNPWIRRYSFNMSIYSAWHERIYQSIEAVSFWMAERIKSIQSGRIQHYLLLLIAALALTLIIAL